MNASSVTFDYDLHPAQNGHYRTNPSETIDTQWEN